MKTAITNSRLWALSLPLIFAGIGETIIDVTDTIFLGRYGIIELGAVVLADAIYEMAVVLIVGITEALQIVIARRAGQGNRRAIGRAFVQGVYLLAGASIVLTLAVRFGAPPLTTALFASEEVAAAASAFLRIIAFAVFFQGLNFAYSAFLVGISRTGALVGATVVLALTNIVLDYCLIFGHFGLPELGIEGAAIASLTAEIGACVFLTAYVLARVDFRTYGLFSFGKWDRQLTRLLAVVGAPVALETLVETARWLVIFVIFERLGEAALAQSNILYQCYVVFLIPIEGISEVVCSRVGHLVGAGKAKRIGLLLREAIPLSYLAVLPLAVVALVVPTQVVEVFTTDQAIISGCANGLRLIALALLVVVPGELFVSAVGGTGDTVANFAFELAGSACVLAYVYAGAFVWELPMEGIWMFVVVGWSVWLALAAYWLKSERWQRLQI